MTPKPPLATVATLAGRELDAAVWSMIHGQSCTWRPQWASREEGYFDLSYGRSMGSELVPHYSTDPAAFFAMVETVRKMGWKLDASETKEGKWLVLL